MNRLIIHTASRLVIAVTVEENPQIPDSFSMIDVPDGFKVEEGKKLGLDNLTLEDAAPADIELFKDDLNPKRVRLKELNALMDDVVGDAALPDNLKLFVSKLKEYLT